MRYLIFFLSLFYSVCAIAQVSISESANWAEKSRVIVVGGDYNFPPYEYVDKQGQPTGYNVEITRTIADIMGINIEIILGDWDDMREAFNAGDVDVLQGMTITEERQKEVTFSPPNVRIQQSIFARTDSAKVQSLNDMRGKKIIVQSQGSMHDYLLENRFTEDEIIPVTTHVDALRLLSSGQHDYAIVANLPGLFLGRELGLSNIEVVGKPFSAGGYTYAVRKGNERLLAQFSEGLAILKNTGKQQEIYDRWLGVLEKEQSLPWPQLGLAALVLSFILLLTTGVVTFWNRSLKIQVDKRTAELHDHQQQLIQADKMSSLGVLVSGVAHEINNPTSLLLLNLPLLKDAWSDAQKVLDKVQQEHQGLQLAGLDYERVKKDLPMVIDDMQGGANRIKRIVEDLKDFARYEVDEHHELISIKNVVQAAIRLVENSIKKSTEHFTVHYDEVIPDVMGNTQRIEQVVVNLLLNACQALTDRNQAVSVSVVYQNKEESICIIVKDEGCGIKEEDMNRLMDPFFTTKREQGGTGLGLSVSQNIAKAHGGSLSFSSLEGDTAATLVLPLNQKQEESDATGE